MLARDYHDGRTQDSEPSNSLDLSLPPSDNAQPPMKLPEQVRQYFVEQGRIGGKKRKQNLTPEQRSASARHASVARWTKTKKSKKAR